jgi:hypothetical protein
MAISEQTTALIATFEDRRDADRFVQELKHAGFAEEEVGVLAPDKDGGHLEEGAAVGALAGSALGAFAGAVATGLIPGVGPVLAAGLFTGIVGGAAAGATAGGLVGGLIGLEVPNEKARHYERELLHGRTLVAVQAVGRGGEATAILRRCRSGTKHDSLAN